jgi:hypothetical protein
MPAETSFQPLGGEVENVRSLSGIRNFSGKEGPRQLGDILDVNVSMPYSDKARLILSNQGLNQFYGTGMTDAEIQDRANRLFELGLGLTKVQKDGGEILYTVVPSASLAAFPDSEIVKPIRPTEPPIKQPEVDARIQMSRIGQGTPFLERLENQRKLVDRDLQTIQTIQEYIDLTGDPDGALNKSLEAAQKKLEKDIGAQGYGEGVIKELESSEGIPVENIPFEDKPFTYPLERRGGEMVPFYRKPGGAADRIEVRKLPKTPEDKDISFKVKAGEEAGRLVDAGQLDTYLQKPVGQSVEQLYKANKAKGNQTDKELLSYIAKEFPRIEYQEIAATTLMGLSYRYAIAGKLG